MIRPFLPCCVLATLLLSGCAMNSPITGSQNVGADETTSGDVHGGQQPVTQATVTLWAAGTANYRDNSATKLATTNTNNQGQFRFPAYTCPSPNAPVYVLAQGGSPQTNGTAQNLNITLGVALGHCSSALQQSIAINELTTAAMAVAMGRFFTTTYGSGSLDTFGTSDTNVTGLQNAMTIAAPLMVSPYTGRVNSGGTANGVTTSVESAKINSIANTLAACVNTTGTAGANKNCAQLFADTRAPGSSSVTPTDTLQAAVLMSLYPYQNVTDLYNLSSGAGAPYIGLSNAPNDWTVAASFTSTNYTLGIFSTQNSQTTTSIDIDQSGNVWFPTNSTTSHGLAYFRPSSGTFAGPYATQLVHPQSVAVDSQGNVWGSDLAKAQLVHIASSSPAANGTVVATTGFTGDISIDPGSTTSQDAVLYVGGGASGNAGSTVYQFDSGAVSAINTFTQPAQAILAYGNAPASSQSVDAGTAGSSTSCNYESFSGTPMAANARTNAFPCNIGGIAPSALGNDDVITTSVNQLCDAGRNGTGSCFDSPITLSTPKGIALDGDSSLWIANSGNGSVSTLANFIPQGSSDYTHTAQDYQQSSTVQYLHGTNNGSTLSTPFGLTIDLSGNVWLSNATCGTTLGSDCSVSGFTLTELIGVAGPTVAPKAIQNHNFDFGINSYGSRP